MPTSFGVPSFVPAAVGGVPATGAGLPAALAYNRPRENQNPHPELATPAQARTLHMNPTLGYTPSRGGYSQYFGGKFGMEYPMSKYDPPAELAGTPFESNVVPALVPRAFKIKSRKLKLIIPTNLAD